MSHTFFHRFCFVGSTSSCFGPDFESEASNLSKKKYCAESILGIGGVVTVKDTWQGSRPLCVCVCVCTHVCVRASVMPAGRGCGVSGL